MSPDGILFDIDALGHHLAKLHYDKGCTALMERPKEGDEPEILKKRNNRLSSWISLWASRRRSISNLQIEDANGVILDSAADCAAALASHWEPVMTEKRVHLALAFDAVKEHVATCPSDFFCKISEDHFDCLLKALVDSGVGIDGLT